MKDIQIIFIINLSYFWEVDYQLFKLTYNVWYILFNDSEKSNIYEYNQLN